MGKLVLATKKKSRPELETVNSISSRQVVDGTSSEGFILKLSVIYFAGYLRPPCVADITLFFFFFFYIA